MNPVPSFPDNSIEALARVMGDCGTGSEIDRALGNLRIIDGSGQSTKWRRLYWVFRDIQIRDKCANRIIEFIQYFLAPVRFSGNEHDFERHRSRLNEVLALSGLEYRPEGIFLKRTPAKTLSEAQERARRIQGKLKGREIHLEVLRYCNAELMQDDYFHAVFEACKGLYQRIRDKSGVDKDGAALVNDVFAIDKPILAFNSLRTETEKTEHKGFAELLRGCYSAVRSPRAHEPRIMWSGEDDAADYFTLISLLYRKVDACVPTRIGESHGPDRLATNG